MQNPNNVEEITPNKSTGPKTDAGKLASSQNAIKHGLFARQLVLLPGETQEQFDDLYNALKAEHKPVGPTEGGLIRQLADISWRLQRVPVLEANALNKALESGADETKIVNTYSIYSHRLTRQFESVLKIFHEEEAKRLIIHNQHYRQAVLIHDYYQRHNLPYDPADDGFVFSKELVEKQLQFNKQWDRIIKEVYIYPTTQYQDELYSNLAL
jgi:hypothetical protein